MTPFTEDEIKRALHLRSLKYQWPQIGSKLERDKDAIRRACKAYQNGTLQPAKMYQRMRTSDAQLEWLVEQGTIRLVDLAAKLNTSPRCVRARAMRLGLDTEMRHELAAEGNQS